MLAALIPPYNPLSSLIKETPMIYQPKNPVGYRNLITWKQAGDIYRLSKEFTRRYLGRMEDGRLIGHINDSARSVQRNIEEGFKRVTTKEYLQFLGFSRASLEELKGDFEELKREWREGIRWADKGKEGVGKEGAEVIKKIEGLLDLIYGVDCMMGRQIKALEEKMVKEKTLPGNELVKRKWRGEKAEDDRFWKLVSERFGIKRAERGVIRVNKGNMEKGS